MLASGLTAGACPLANTQSPRYLYGHKRRSERKNTFFFHQAMTAGRRWAFLFLVLNSQGWWACFGFLAFCAYVSLVAGLGLGLCLSFLFFQQELVTKKLSGF